MPADLSELADADLYPYERAWPMVYRVCSVLTSGGTSNVLDPFLSAEELSACRAPNRW
jgi:hypothetical protein